MHRAERNSRSLSSGAADRKRLSDRLAAQIPKPGEPLPLEPEVMTQL
jgi:hypothetical protein